MAFERYISKSGRLFIVIKRLYAVVKFEGSEELYTSPTTVELLNVDKEQLQEIKHVEFETMLSEGKLTRVTT